MRNALILVLVLAASPTFASDIKFCQTGAPMLRAEVTAASDLLASSDKMAQPMVASGADAALAALSSTLDDPELTAFSDYARSYENLRPELIEYIQRLGIAASAMEECAAK